MAGLVIAVVGLGFGEEFVPLYRSHPDVERVVLVEQDPRRLRAVAERWAIPAADARGSLDDVLADPSVDAVHLLTPVPTHADLAVRVLESGRHCACAVPMGGSLEDLERVRAAELASGARYMMMETAVFAREFFEVRAMLEAGEIGEPSLYRGFHLQNIDGFPWYWQGFPPLGYATHALAPALALLDTTVARVTARGAGRLRPDQSTGGYDNPFAAEVALLEPTTGSALLDVTVAFFNTARAYIEGFALHGDRGGVEWPADNEGPLTVHAMSAPAEGTRGNRVAVSTRAARDRADLLPEPLRPFVRATDVQLAGMPASVHLGSGHGGSHPHLVHEFVSAVVAGRAPSVDGARAAEWTAPGIMGHTSALRRGEPLDVPRYR